jgi:hypothetical protein
MTDATPQPPRVIGLLAVRDEWPLAAVALVHALLHHVDAVVVLDHASSDATPAGLALLKASALGERIQLLHLDSEAFRQEAFMNAMVEVSQAWAPDWIYPFDADEFLLAPGGLKALLASLPEQLLAVHYPLENWISTPDFDDSDLDGYLNLQIRSLPDLEMPPVMEPSMVQAIAEGQTNYFRRPFGGKVIFRNTTTAWLEAGSHSLRPFLRSQSLLAHRTHLRGAHVPLLSRVRLNRKAAIGRRHQQAGAPSSFGWQNQKLAQPSQVQAVEPTGLELSVEAMVIGCSPGRRLHPVDGGLKRGTTIGKSTRCVDQVTTKRAAVIPRPGFSWANVMDIPAPMPSASYQRSPLAGL